MDSVYMQRKKARKFAKALAEWDWFKAEIARYVAEGSLNEEQANTLLEDKAEQLDL